MPEKHKTPSAAVGEDPPLLDGRTALVTGASQGIGAAVARRLARAGARVVVHYRSNAPGAGDVVRAIEDAGGEALAVPGDLAVPATAEAIVERTVAHFGGIDILVNNAGTYPTALLLDMSADEWSDMQRANVESAVSCTRAAARRMRAAGGGAVLNVASIEAANPGLAHSHYAASKAALVAFTRAAAQELGPAGIRVNSVSPGLVERPGIREDWPEGVDRWERKVPLGRLCTADDVADACLFLVSDAARFVSGQDLAVDGGMLATSIF